MAVNTSDMLNTNPLAAAMPWPKDLRVHGTSHGRPFTGILDPNKSRYIGGSFLYRVELDEPMGEFLMVMLEINSNSKSDTLEWLNA